MKVEAGYYGDGEDAYDMTKFFKPEVERDFMKNIVQPTITNYPGAIIPIIEYEDLKKDDDSK